MPLTQVDGPQPPPIGVVVALGVRSDSVGHVGEAGADPQSVPTKVARTRDPMVDATDRDVDDGVGHIERMCETRSGG